MDRTAESKQISRHETVLYIGAQGKSMNLGARCHIGTIDKSFLPTTSLEDVFIGLVYHMENVGEK